MGCAQVGWLGATSLAERSSSSAVRPTPRRRRGRARTGRPGRRRRAARRSRLYESAMVDGASVWRQFWQMTLPLCRPPLAALATLEVTWIYNEFFWATVLMQSGDKYPVTSSLNNLRGQFFTDNNLVAAGSLIVAVLTLAIYFALQKHFVAGLTLGATKG
ncbi:carbohydrate ABC transporter permease [Arsenicicoccus bolidensis]|nr:ABC transporter permease subunit [Arsenicicoccus bolidensis]